MYPHNQVKFEVARADIEANFAEVSKVLTEVRASLANVNFQHVVVMHDELYKSIILTLSPPSS